MQTQNHDNVQKHKEEIITMWKLGGLVTTLAKKYKTNVTKIRKIIEDAVGHEEYRRVVRSRTGAGSRKRREHPTYPDWMS